MCNCQALEEARQEKAALEACAAEHAAATGRKDFAASLGMMQASPPCRLRHASTRALQQRPSASIRWCLAAGIVSM